MLAHLSNDSTGRLPFKWLPLSFSSSSVCTAGESTRGAAGAAAGGSDAGRVELQQFPPPPAQARYSRASPLSAVCISPIPIPTPTLLPTGSCPSPGPLPPAPSPFVTWNLAEGPPGALATHRYRSLCLRASKYSTLEQPCRVAGTRARAGGRAAQEAAFAGSGAGGRHWQLHLRGGRASCTAGLCCPAPAPAPPPHLEVCHLVDGPPLRLGVQLGILFAVRQQLPQVQHQVPEAARREGGAGRGQ